MTWGSALTSTPKITVTIFVNILQYQCVSTYSAHNFIPAPDIWGRFQSNLDSSYVGAEGWSVNDAIYGSITYGNLHGKLT